MTKSVKNSFKESEAIKVFHSFCNLSVKHINAAKRCIGFNLKEINDNKFIIKKNSFIVFQSDKTWEKLYKIGFAQVTRSSIVQFGLFKIL